MTVLVAVLALPVLMFVHESGHHLAARAFGMRVIRFSIGFGPTLLRYQRDSTTTIFQVAAIPFFAFVQIAGMNPFDEQDPEDRASYANASVIARIVTIVAGPAANYLFAALLLSGVLFFNGSVVVLPVVDPMPASAASAAGIRNGDRILTVQGKSVTDFDELCAQIIGRPGQPTKVTVERAGARVDLTVTPTSKHNATTGVDEGDIGVTARVEVMPLPRAVYVGFIGYPRTFLEAQLTMFKRVFVGQETLQLSSPISIANVLAKAAEHGVPRFVSEVAFISLALAVTNLLPFPALDGGRLGFLLTELVTRRKPDPRVEAQIHLVGILVLLSMLVVVSFSEIKDKLFGKAANRTEQTSPDRRAQPKKR